MYRNTIAGWITPLLLSAIAGTALAVQPAGDAPPPARPPMPAQPAGGLVTDPSTKPKPEPVSKTVKQAEKQKVTVSDSMSVDMSVKDENISAVLEMLAVQSRKNIIASKSVSGKVSADLFGVTFYEALEAILNVNGFAFREQGNFIYVYTQAEMEQITRLLKPRVAKVFRLNYLTAPDAAEFVKPMLSQGGEIKHNNKTENYAISDSAPTGKDDFALAATMVVIDFEENIRAVEQLLVELDTKPAQVLVEATVLSATVQEDNAFGVDFSIIGDLSFKDFANATLGGPFGIVDTLRKQPAPVGTGNAVTSDVGGTGKPGGFKVGIVGDNVSVFLRALDAVTNTTVLANPKILALNRQVARVLVGQRIGYLSSTATETSTTQTVQFLDTGVQLHVRPFINASKNEVRMELRPQFSKATIKNLNGPNGSQIVIPDEDTQEITTNVIVPDGMTVVLGGLFREDVTSGRQQVPLMGDIPIIGAAFRGQNDSTTRTEIIFLLTPRIVSDPAMGALGDRATDQIERVRAGSRQGQLPFSRDRMTATLNMEAEQAARDGDVARAQWLIQRSLALNTNQAEVYRLREKLTGEREVWPTRSLFEDVIDKDVAERLRSVRENSSSPALTPWRSVKVPKQPSREFPTGGKPGATAPVAPGSPTAPAAATEAGLRAGSDDAAYVPVADPAASATLPVSQTGASQPRQAASTQYSRKAASGFVPGTPIAQQGAATAQRGQQELPLPMQTQPVPAEAPGSMLSNAGNEDSPSSDPAVEPN